ncbi:Kinesin-like protein KIF2C [Liparis tanakae]|uniref:Kinesin-like protein n=1 Tax=Liparis tanakae TaxID=230148 RepID=A0A4Z2GR16_9TELE|nr:Kinesin-like protein KIF2C [Liparis tanakae]
MDINLFSKLIGAAVKISRSDGRVHLAKVKSIGAVDSTVMVEWTEGTFCRAKELEVIDLCKLNPELVAQLKADTNRSAEPPTPAPDKLIVRPGRRACSGLRLRFSLRFSLQSPPPTSPHRSSQTLVGRKSMAPQELNKGSKRLSCVAKPPNMSVKRGKFGEPSRPNQKFYDMIQDFRETLEITPFSSTHHVSENSSVPFVKLPKPLVQSIFEGGMATCFAYGQTGSGKTHTMGGDFTGRQQDSSKGIYAMAAQDVFTYLNHRKFAHLELSAYVSFFEIYNGKVYDLLNEKAKLRVLEDDRQQVQVVGLEEVYVSKAEETSANANSSRSHAILQIVLRRNDRATTLHGKFSLVDLAGNERGIDVSSNDRSTLVETAEINRSLLALKECIRSLGMNSDHIPFRLCTLTKVLRDSFIGEKVKELKGNTKASAAAVAQEPMNSSTEEESVEDASEHEVISKVAELKEKAYEQFQRTSQVFSAMGHNIEEGVPDLVANAKKLLEVALALQTAVDQERVKRRGY